MPLIKCADCGHDVSDRASVCPNCGCPVEISIKEAKGKQNTENNSVKQESNSKPVKKRKFLIFAIIAVAVIAFEIIMLCLGSKNDFKSDAKNNSLATDLKKITCNGIECYSVSNVCYPTVFGEPKLTEAEIAYLLAEGDPVKMTETVNTVPDCLILLSQKHNDSEDIDNQDAEETLLRGGNQPYGWCCAMLYLLSGDYEDSGRIDLQASDNGYCYVAIKQDGNYYAFDPFEIKKMRWIPLEGEEYSASDVQVLTETLKTNCPYSNFISAEFIKNTYVSPNATEIIEASNATETIKAPNGEELELGMRLGTEIYNYAGTDIPLGLGLPLLTDNEIDELISLGQSETVAEKITTLADAVNYMRRAGFTFITADGSPSTVDNAMIVDVGNVFYNNNGMWCYTVSGLETTGIKVGNCASLSTFLNYILHGDYPEIGYMYIVFSDTDGHAMIYIEGNDKMYYLINPVQYTYDGKWLDYCSNSNDKNKGCAASLDELMAAFINGNCVKHNTKVKYLITFVMDGVYCRGSTDGHRQFDSDPIFYFPEGSNPVSWGEEVQYEEKAAPYTVSQTYVFDLKGNYN